MNLDPTPLLRPTRPALRGFTLLELLLAVAVAAVVLAAVNAVFYAALRLQRTTSRAVEASLPRQRAFAIIRHDLAHLVVPGGTLFGALQSTPTSSTNSTSALLPGQLYEGQVSPDFCTASGRIDSASPWAEVEKVAYVLATPATPDALGRDLTRVVTRNLLPTTQPEAPEQSLLLSGVETVTFYYHDGTAWRDTWDSTTEETILPRAIKLQIQFAAEANRARLPLPVELVVPIMVEPGTNTTTQAEATVP